MTFGCTARYAAIFALVVGSLVSCATDGTARPSDPTRPTEDAARSMELTRSQFDDIPVPRDFTYVNKGNQSFSYSQGGVRVGKFRYWGQDPVDDVVSFYKRTMSLMAYDWQFVSESEEQLGLPILQFAKGRQSCTIRVAKIVGSTQVDIDVAGTN